MTRNAFDRLAAHYGIAPPIALENENLRRALRERNTAEVERILKEEF